MMERVTKSYDFGNQVAVAASLNIHGENIRSLKSFEVGFESQIELNNCHIDYLQIIGGVMLKGLVCRDCVFKRQFDMLYTGHNRDGGPVHFDNCRFEVFADFMDCWFEGPVELNDCTFIHGTNLLGNIGKPFAVTFDIPPQIRNVKGDLCVST